MALVTEDGTGLADAESYISVTDADTYHAARGNTAWAALVEAAKEQALRKAADYMGQTFGSLWSGYRVSTTQALDWPRYNAPRRAVPETYWPSDEVPVEVQRACAELALRASSADLLADTTQAVQSVSAGSVSVTFAQGTKAGAGYPAVNRMLEPFLSGGGQVRLVRA